MKRTLLMITLIISITINSVFAQNAVKLDKGEKAPFSGALVVEETLDELVKAKKSNIVLKDLRITQDEIIEYHKDQARTYRKKLSQAKWDGFWSNTGYFILGVVLTGFAFKVNQKIGDI